MRIIFVTSEAVPYAKTGGLGDVAGALPHALAKLGHDVKVFLPYYKATKKVVKDAPVVAEGQVPVGTEMLSWQLHEAPKKEGEAAFYFVGNDPFFDRDGVYGDRRGDYNDSCSRFVFFNRAVLQAVEKFDEPVDIYHCHDWACGLIPVYLKVSLAEHPLHGSAASLFTIHNLSYQGLFWHWDWPLLNLPWKHFNWKEMEFHGKINFLKGALVYADILNTVSPTYAKEIQTAEFGCGLEGVLELRTEDLFGVVNGIDQETWNPRTDEYLPHHYDIEDLSGKKKCKKALLEAYELPSVTRKNNMLVGLISRLVEQKGIDLVIKILADQIRKDVQFVILGTGDAQYEKQLKRMREVYPEHVGVKITYDNKLAHLIEAGADAFLMPSQFEPCGLNQMYSQRYGTVPLVRRIGGLEDTVVDATPKAMRDREATGFTFSQHTKLALNKAFGRMWRMYTEKPKQWKALKQVCMQQDWSWDRSAKAYVGLYEQALTKAKMRRP